MLKPDQQYYDSMIDWLSVCIVSVNDPEKIKAVNEREVSITAPFVMRVSTGSQEDQPKEIDCEGGINIDVFDEIRNVEDKPLLTIRLPLGTLKLIGRFSEMLPYDPNE